MAGLTHIRAPVLGIDCFAGEPSSAADLVVARALSGRGGYACLANVHVVVTARRDPRLRAALDSAWSVFPDGTPIAWAQRRCGSRASRIAGPDLMSAVLDRGRDAGLRHFLVGSTPEVLADLERSLAERLDGLQIVGCYSPAEGEEDSPATLRRIARATPHVVWVALGAPKQERWAARHAAALSPAMVVGVGAAFDFHAGHKRRAPQWMQRAGLEWLHRLAHEPRRLGWRYVSTNTLFGLAILRGISRGDEPRTQTRREWGVGSAPRKPAPP